MNTRSKSTLFLMEQTVVIIIFAICASVCAAILADSYLLTGQTGDKSSALRTAQSAAECFKASRGDIRQAIAFLGGGTGDCVYYDENWQVCDSDVAVYDLTFNGLRSETEASPVLCEVTVKECGGAEIVSFTVAARRETA